MFDDDDDLQPTQAGAPELPRALKEKLFDYSEPAMPALRYSSVGPEKWPPSTAYGARLGFTVWKNPTARDVRMHLNLGPDPNLHSGFEMALVPAQYRIPRGRALELFKIGQPLRREYTRVLICIPAGETLALPAIWDQAIRTVKDGWVVAGMAPQLVVNDEQNPPPLHSSLIPESDKHDPPPAARAAARRRT